MLKHIFLLALLSSCTIGCGLVKTLDPKGEQFERHILNCARDTSFIIENKSIAVSATFNVEGNLSHSAQLLWSFEPLDTLAPSSQIPASVREISLPAGQVDVDDSKEYYGKKLYVRYIPSSDSTSGNLLLKVKI